VSDSPSKSHNVPWLHNTEANKHTLASGNVQCIGWHKNHASTVSQKKFKTFHWAVQRHVLGVVGPSIVLIYCQLVQ